MFNFIAASYTWIAPPRRTTAVRGLVAAGRLAHTDDTLLHHRRRPCLLRSATTIAFTSYLRPQICAVAAGPSPATIDLTSHLPARTRRLTARIQPQRSSLRAHSRRPLFANPICRAVPPCPPRAALPHRGSPQSAGWWLSEAALAALSRPAQNLNPSTRIPSRCSARHCAAP